MLKTIEIKLYLKPAQQETLERWLGKCCWIFNRALGMRTKAYRRRGQSIGYNAQSAWLTQLRKRDSGIEAVPLGFVRGGALKRIDRAMQAFFRRCKSGERPGYPRFRSAKRFDSMETCEPGKYIRNGNMIAVPKLGLVRFRGGNQAIAPTQRLLRIIRRASGWYAQVLIEDGKPAPEKRLIESSVGVDVGLSAFATFSTGEKIENPRWLNRSSRQLRHAQRVFSRRVKGSKRRRRAVHRVRMIHERIAARRKDFCHQQSRRLVNQHDLIAVEKLNVKGMARSRFAKSILDAGWSIFTNQLRYKAESAGSQLVEVDPRHTSQDCSNCGSRVPKELSERVHCCTVCGFQCDRDHNAAMNILNRALSRGPKMLVEESASGCRAVCDH